MSNKIEVLFCSPFSSARRMPQASSTLGLQLIHGSLVRSGTERSFFMRRTFRPETFSHIGPAADVRHAPWSTFKIPNLLILLKRVWHATIDAIRSVSILSETDGYVLRGKTGSGPIVRVVSPDPFTFDGEQLSELWGGAAGADEPELVTSLQADRG